MNLVTLLAQFLGIVGFILLILSFMQKRKRNIFVVQVISYSFYCLTYYMLGALSGFSLSVIHLARSFFMAVKDKYKILNNNFPLFIFIVLYVVCGLKTYQDIFSLFPLIAVVIYTSMIWQGNSKEIRVAGIINALLWLVYDIHVKAIGALVGDISIAISTSIVLASMIKDDKRKVKSSTF